jgi:hypothetical protein
MLTKMTPFESLYGYPPLSIKEYVFSKFKAPTVKNYLATSDEILCILKSHLEQSRNQIKKQVDLKRSNCEFEVGDWVFVKLQLYKQNSLKNYKNHKLAPKFYGPYQVQRRVGQVAYVLDIPNKGKLHDVFHVSCLKKNLGPTTLIQSQLPLLDEEGRLILKPKGILEVRTKVLHSRSFNEYLIKWKNMTEEEATWKMKTSYKSFILTHASRSKHFEWG